MQSKHLHFSGIGSHNLVMQTRMDPSNFTGEMDLDVPLQINIVSAPNEGSGNADVDDLTRRVAQVRLNVKLRVFCHCANFAPSEADD